MAKKRYYQWLIILALFLIALFFIISKSRQVITSRTLLDYQVLLEQPEGFKTNLWRALYVDDILIDPNLKIIHWQGQGEMFLIAPANLNFSYHDYDQLTISLKVDKVTELTVVPDILKSGQNSFEYRKFLFPSQNLQTYQFSLRHPFWQKPIETFGFMFYSPTLTKISLQKVVIAKNNPAGVLLAAWHDFWLTDRYAAYTANFFPTPRIFGHSALKYFLPLLILLIILVFWQQRYTRLALVILLLFWLVFDWRTSYEFFSYLRTDYKTWVSPPYQEKLFRYDANLYQFMEFVKEKTSFTDKIYLYSQSSQDMTGKLRYFLYPQEVQSAGQGEGVYVVLENKAVSYNLADKKLYREGLAISPPGEVIGIFDNKFFIFATK